PRARPHSPIPLVADRFYLAGTESAIRSPELFRARYGAMWDWERDRGGFRSGAGRPKWSLRPRRSDTELLRCRIRRATPKAIRLTPARAARPNRPPPCLPRCPMPPRLPLAALPRAARD